MATLYATGMASRRSESRREEHTRWRFRPVRIIGPEDRVGLEMVVLSGCLAGFVVLDNVPARPSQLFATISL